MADNFGHVADAVGPLPALYLSQTSPLDWAMEGRRFESDLTQTGENQMPYTVVNDVMPLGATSSMAEAINDAGQIIGQAEPGGAVRWSPSGKATVFQGGDEGVAINDAGWGLVWAADFTSPCCGRRQGRKRFLRTRAARATALPMPSTRTPGRASICRTRGVVTTQCCGRHRGSQRFLRTRAARASALPKTSTTPARASDFPILTAATPPGTRCYGRRQGRRQFFKDVGGQGVSFANAINDAGQSIGYYGGTDADGVLWSASGVATVLGIGPTAINDAGQVVGDSTTVSAGSFAAVSRSPSGKMTVLPNVGGLPNSFVNAINDFGQSVGFSASSILDDTPQALWSPSGKARTSPTFWGQHGVTPKP